MEIRKNFVKETLAQGDIALVAGGFTHPDDVELFGHSLKSEGFHGIWIEGEHGWVSPSELGNITRACDICGLTSVVRINANSQPLIYRTLDRGAQGIIVPHVNSKAEAVNVVQGGKFTPIGQRGMFVSRQGYNVSNYFEKANSETLLVILIEDIIAINNLDEILTVDNIDVFFVAPSDLSASMGRLDAGNGAETKQIIKNALAKISDAGRIGGTMVNNQNVAEFAEAGAKFLFAVVNPWIQSGAKEFRNLAYSAGC